MSSVSMSSALIGPAYDIAVAKKQLASTKEQGQQALALIQSAAAVGPAPAPQGSVGQLLNITA